MACYVFKPSQRSKRNLLRVMLEYVGDFDKFMAEISRVLAKGVLFFFDTINRILESKIGVIYLMQKCRFTSIVRPRTHVWDMFIKPDELKTILYRNNIILNDMKGLGPQTTDYQHFF